MAASAACLSALRQCAQSTASDHTGSVARHPSACQQSTSALLTCTPFHATHCLHWRHQTTTPCVCAAGTRTSRSIWASCHPWTSSCLFPAGPAPFRWRPSWLLHRRRRPALALVPTSRQQQQPAVPARTPALGRRHRSFTMCSRPPLRSVLVSSRPSCSNTLTSMCAWGSGLPCVTPSPRSWWSFYN